MPAATVQAVWAAVAEKMNNKAKNIAVCGISAAAATLCLACCTLPGVKWIALILAVVASLCVTIPLLVNPKNIVFTILTYIAASTIGIVVSLGNVLYIVPIVTIFMPTAIVKVYGESTKCLSANNSKDIKHDDTTNPKAVADTASKDETTSAKAQATNADPFVYEENTQITPVEQTKLKQRIPTAVRWALYYMLLEVGIALTLFVTHLVTPDVFDTLVKSMFFIPLIVAAQLVPPLYVQLLSGCFRTISKILRKVLN